MNFTEHGKALWKRAVTIVLGRRQAYRDVFGTPEGKIILQDLAQFCRAFESCAHSDPYAHAMLEGRREVWLRIQQYCHFEEDELLAIYKLQRSEQEELSAWNQTQHY